MSDDVFPAPYEIDPPPPDERRRCPACHRGMHFTHYDTGQAGRRGPWPPGRRMPAPQLAYAIALPAVALPFAMAWGVAAGIVAMLVAAMLLALGLRRHFAQRAVWFCMGCDAYYIGPRLRRWRTPASPQRRHMIE
jgi:hypothetical protein